jgi:hypothetical protein
VQELISKDVDSEVQKSSLAGKDEQKQSKQEPVIIVDDNSEEENELIMELESDRDQSRPKEDK